MFLYQILVYVIHEKLWKTNITTINLKSQLQRGTKNLNYLTDDILYETFKIISGISSKNMKQ